MSETRSLFFARVCCGKRLHFPQTKAFLLSMAEKERLFHESLKMGVVASNVLISFAQLDISGQCRGVNTGFHSEGEK